jgi:chorismate--pyruvate lyase
MIDLTWFENLDLVKPQPDSNIYNWLTKPYILSKALKQCCSGLTVKILSQSVSEIYNSESFLLNISTDTQSFTRQVFLLGDGIPLTYGRVIVPPNTYKNHFSDFERLGGNLLGETMLYNNTNVKRGKFQYSVIDNKSILFEQISKYLLLPNVSLWCRCSLFYNNKDPLLVTEVFLPQLPLFPEKFELTYLDK